MNDLVITLTIKTIVVIKIRVKFSFTLLIVFTVHYVVLLENIFIEKIKNDDCYVGTHTRYHDVVIRSSKLIRDCFA